MDTQRVQHIEAVRAELAETFQHYGAVAELHKKYTQAIAILDAIVAEAQASPSGGRWIRSAGAWRRLPDDLSRLIDEAAEMIGD